MILGYLLLAAAYGIALSWMDWRTRRLPNWLTVGGLTVALVIRWGDGGIQGLLNGFAAAAVAGAFLLLPFLARGAGGGDVKMMAAAGAIVGWSRLIHLLWYASLAGLVLGIGMLVAGRLDSARVKHGLRSLFDWRYDRKAGAAALPKPDATRQSIPFSIAITVGMLAALMVR